MHDTCTVVIFFLLSLSIKNYNPIGYTSQMLNQRKQPQQSIEDIQIALDIIQGYSNAEISLVQKYQERLYCFCRTKLKDKEKIKDAVQETFSRAIENIRNRKVKNLNAISSYIYGVARIVCLQQIRQERRELVESFDSIEPDPALIEEPAIDEWIDAEDSFKIRKALYECLELLLKIDYNILILFFFQKLTNRQISKKYQITEQNVAIRKMRALSQLRGCIDEKGYDYDDVFF